MPLCGIVAIHQPRVDVWIRDVRSELGRESDRSSVEAQLLLRFCPIPAACGAIALVASVAGAGEAATYIGARRVGVAVVGAVHVARAVAPAR